MRLFDDADEVEAALLLAVDFAEEPEVGVDAAHGVGAVGTGEGARVFTAVFPLVHDGGKRLQGNASGQPRDE